MGQREDEELIQRLYEVHAHRVLGYALRRGASRPDAEDLVIETFLTCWRRLDDVDDPGLPWLLGIARRVLANQRRASGRRAELEKRLIKEEPPASDAPGPETDRELLHALRDLSERDREVLLLTAWDGLSHEEAAETLGISRNTFSTRWNRARVNLRLRLEPQTAQIDLVRTEETAEEEADKDILMDTP
jgi:RNA polymerase sigma-70 factor, ECF subfamily